MDDIINLGTFDFDLNRLNQNLDTARSRMFELNKQQEANKKQYRDMQKEIDELVKVQGLLENSNAETSEAYRENEARIQALTEAQRANFKVQQDTATQISRVRTEINQTNTQLRAYMTTEGEFISLTEKGNKALQAEINNKNDAIANNKELREIVNQLNPSIQEEADMIKMLNERIDENTQFIRENSSGYDQLKMDIGSYKEQIIAAAQELNPMNGGLAGFIGRAREAGGVGPLFTSTFTALRSGLVGATQAGLAFLATPIGAAIAALAIAVGLVIGAFKFMTASMNSTEEGSQKLAKITSTISGLFTGFFKILKPIGEFLGNVFIAYIEAVGEALDTMTEGLASALEFIGADEWAAGVRGVKEEVKASAKAAGDLAVAEGKLTKARREAEKIQLDYQRQEEKLRQARDDESKSIGERIQLNTALGQVLEQQAAEELKIAKLALEAAELRIIAEGRTAEALDAQAEALTKISDIEERIEGQRSEQLANLNSLRKEAADAEKQRQEEAMARRQKELDDIVQKKKDEIDLYVAGEAGKKKALQDSLTFEETLSKKRLDLIQKEFNAGKMSKEAYEAEKLNITNEYALKQIDIINEYAEAEIALYKQANQSKITNETLLTEAIVAEEERRLNELRRMDLEQLQMEKQTNDEIIAAKKLRNEQLTLDEIEYQTQRLAIDQQYNQQIDTNRQSFNAQVKARDLAQQEADKELALLNANNEYERQLLEEQERYDAGLVRLNERLQKEQVTRQQYDELMLAYQQQNAEKEKQINDAKEQAIRSQYAATFGNVAKLLGEKTAAGKAASIAEATINTYNGITQVWASPSTLPEPFATVAKAVNTGVVLASGLAAVKKISSVDTKGVAFEQGGLQEVGGRRHYAGGTVFRGDDGTEFEAERGELIGVLNRNAASAFMAFNNAFPAGGTGLNAATSALSQNEITQKADNSQLSTVVANAVMIGAREGTALGSQTGITELSNNRKVMADAKF